MDVVEELNKHNEKLGKQWHEYKEANNERLVRIEKGLGGTAEIEAKLAKINDAMNKTEEARDALTKKTQERMDALEAAVKRRSESQTKTIKFHDGSGVREITVDESWDKACKSFGGYLREGADSKQSGGREVWQGAGIDKKSMSVRSDPDGGYFVTADFTGRVVVRIFETSPLRRLASVQVINTDRLEGGDDLDEADAGWVGESDSRSETGTPQAGRWSIPVHEMYANPKVTQNVLDDANIDIEGLLARKVGDKMARTETTAMVLNGDGVKKPRGILTLTSNASTYGWTKTSKVVQHVLSGSSGAIAADSLLEVPQTMKAPYLAGAVWAMHRQTMGLVRKLKDGQNRYLWEPSLQAGIPAQLLGYPVEMFNDMLVAVTSGAVPIMFGNFKEAYQIVDRQGVRVLRDPYTSKGFVSFYSTRRVGGDVINGDALKFYKTT